ncbi:MAG: tRNA (adenine37-N6)-methyltransferase [Anaerophaga sp.]|nr:tRNA (adenine37-N6)-methyltransferase [Anaerophaga sp.]MDN5291486.1 tRNA (adenine37-N6)-methyltransferase [Anaerophaga sp.]
MEIQPIGYVKNELKEPEHVKNAHVKNTEEIISKIVIDKKFESGLYKIEYQKFIDVIFYFHKSGEFNLVGPIFTGETRGVFASRSPRRPNGLGVSTVRLLKRQENILIVSGLDAIDGTPVIDLKPADFSFFRQNNV